MSHSSNIARQRAAGLREGGPAYLARRTQIKRAAARVFRLRGYRGTTLTHIAEEMGTDRASLYYYVSGKQELLEEMVSEAIGINLERAEAIRDGPGTGAERLRLIIRSLMGAYAEFYPVLYVLIGENLKYLEPERAEWVEQTRRVVNAYEQVIIDIVAAGQRDGTIRDTTPAWLIAYGITGMVSWSNRWFRPEAREMPRAEEIGEAFAAMVLDGLRPTSGG